MAKSNFWRRLFQAGSKQKVSVGGKDEFLTGTQAYRLEELTDARKFETKSVTGDDPDKVDG